MSLIDIYNQTRGRSTRLVTQVAGACIVAARDIINEDPGTANHDNRVAWATTILDEEQSVMARRMMSRVMLNTTLAADPENADDGDVQFVVNGLIDQFANALVATQSQG